MKRAPVETESLRPSTGGILPETRIIGNGSDNPRLLRKGIGVRLRETEGERGRSDLLLRLTARCNPKNIRAEESHQRAVDRNFGSHT
jgi:hypothetical protein